MVSEGEVSGSSATGSVKAIWRRTGVTGMVTPTMSPMLRDQAPAAQTTVLVAMRPHSVHHRGDGAAAAVDVGDRAMSDDAGAVAAGGGSVAHHHGFGRGLAVVRGPGRGEHALGADQRGDLLRSLRGDHPARHAVAVLQGNGFGEDSTLVWSERV